MSQQVIIPVSKLNQVADLLQEASYVMRDFATTEQHTDLVSTQPTRPAPKPTPQSHRSYLSKLWKQWEQEADADIAEGRVKGFSNVDALIADLNS
jgi:hypothetical protein